MKNLISILILFVAVGCGKTEVETEIKSDIKKLEDKVIGSYERKKDEHTFKLVLLENGKVYFDGEEDGEVTWKILEKEVHVGDEEKVMVFAVEPNGDLSFVAQIIEGKRTVIPKEEQATFKKLKE